ncbi:hypothetical protein [Acidisoma sp. 7E03]
MESEDSQKLPPLTLSDLVDDSRLGRLFSPNDRSCALQLWVLQLRFGDVVQNRILYGRLLPYNHSDNSWHARSSDEFKKVGELKAQVIKLSLYVRGALCKEMLSLLSVGKSISELSATLQLEISDKLSSRVGKTKLNPTDLAYRPVSYLLNRDARDGQRLTSPHGSGGALSASIVQTNKSTLFLFDQYYDPALARFVVQELNSETGLEGVMHLG